MASGQLDDTRLTLLDLNEIIDSFAATLRGIYHPRLLYPSLDKPATLDVSTRPNRQDQAEPGLEALQSSEDEPAVVQTPPAN